MFVAWKKSYDKHSMYVFSCSVVSDLCDPEEPSSSVHGDSPGKNSGVDCHSLLLQGIFPIQKSNPWLPHCRWILYCQPPVKHMTNLDSTLKSRDIALLTKVCTVRAMVFPVVMYGYESWTIKKAKWQRIDAFELWCWRRLLRVPWTARRSNPSVRNEINPEYSLEELILKLKFQYFDHLTRNVDTLEKTLMLGKIEGRGRRGQQRTRWLDGSIDSMDMSLSKLWKMVFDRDA